MPPPQPRSTLFPYTTLFRSTGQRPFLGETYEQVMHAHTTSLPRPIEYYRSDVPRDRKSTRLNSSHVAISYAVFCLKKKNNNRTSGNRSASSDTTNSRSTVVS